MSQCCSKENEDKSVKQDEHGAKAEFACCGEQQASQTNEEGCCSGKDCCSVDCRPIDHAEINQNGSTKKCC